MEQRIISAIQSRRVLSLVCEGRFGAHKRPFVDLEPYIYGRLASGDDFLFGWQRTGLLPNWRAVWLPRVRDLRVIGQSFEAPRPGSDAAISCLGHVAAVYYQIEGVLTAPLAALAP